MSGQDHILSILDDYLIEFNSGTINPNATCASRLKALGKSEDQIHETLMEMQHEFKREQLMLVKTSNAKPMIVYGLLGAVFIAILTIIFALVGALTNGRDMLLPFLLVAAGLFIFMKGWIDQKAKKHFYRRRIIKWKNW